VLVNDATTGSIRMPAYQPCDAVRARTVVLTRAGRTTWPPRCCSRVPGLLAYGEDRVRAAGAEADGRLVLGHLEGDLIIGAKNSQVATLVDRKSRYLIMVAARSRHTATVIPALVSASA
jgi:hypothetical protein